MSNDAQREYWNGPGGNVWVEAQDHMDRMLAPISDLGLAKAAALDGERIIDVGCGCGATSLALARSGAGVWGVDISAPMIARAKARAAEGDVNNVAFSVADASNQTYTPDHHLVFSRFGVMFFEDPKHAFATIRTGLMPGGRLVFLCWQKPRENQWMSIAGRAVQPFLPPTEQGDPRAPGPFAFADSAWIEEILGVAGFSSIEIESVTPELLLGHDLDEAMFFQGKVGPLARVLAELDDESRQKATAAAREALAEHLTEEGIRLGSAAWLVSARNPS